MPNTFVIKILTKGNYVCYLDRRTEFVDKLTSPDLKKWKTKQGAEKFLKSISDSLKEYSDIKQASVIECSQEIQAALDEEETYEFEKSFKSLRHMAAKHNIINSGSVYRQMVLRLAEELVSLTEGDSVLYFPQGYDKDCDLVLVEKVGISTFIAGGISANRLTGDSRFLPNNKELIDYFAAYTRIQRFIKNWESASPADFIQISKAILELE